MNFKVNLFFHLYETHITPLGIPIPTDPRVSDGRVIEESFNNVSRKFQGDVGHIKAKKQVDFKIHFR